MFQCPARAALLGSLLCPSPAKGLTTQESGKVSWNEESLFLETTRILFWADPILKPMALCTRRTEEAKARVPKPGLG